MHTAALPVADALCIEPRLTRWKRDFVYDLRFSARSFLGNASFTTTAVPSRALEIGQPPPSTLYLIRSFGALPVREPERLVLIDWNGDQASVNALGSYNLMSYPICRDLHQQERFFDVLL